MAIQINQYGFRESKPFGKQTSQGVFVVGDSFGFGWGVEETERFSNVLEQLLKIPVYNIAVPANIDGYSHLVDYALKTGAQVKRLIIAICMENDLINYQSLPSQYSTPTQQPQNTSFPVSRTTIKSYLSRYSALYGAITTAVHKNPGLKSILTHAGWITQNIDGMNRNRYDEKIIESSANRLKQLIEKSWTEQHLVVLIPSRGLWTGGNEETERLVHRHFIHALKKQRLNVIDLKPFFEQKHEPLSYHFATDGHWNRDGHGLAARSIADHIITHRLFTEKEETK